MTRFQLQLVLVCVMGVSVGIPAPSAQTVRVVAKPTPPRVTTFTETVDGDWRTTIKLPDGSERPYTFVPSTKVEPTVRSAVSLVGAGDELRFRYQYRLLNGANARQELAWLWIHTAQPVQVIEPPARWTYAKPQSAGVVSFYGPLTGDTPRGVPAGASAEGPILEGSVLPGIVSIRTMGNTNGVVERPAGLSQTQQAELLELSRATTVNVYGIGPAIPAGRGAPELTFDVLLVRVATHYSVELRKHQHPRALEIANAFTQIAQAGASLADQKVLDGLATIRRLSRVESDVPWHREMSQALEVCIDALTTGALPYRGALTPDKVGAP